MIRSDFRDFLLGSSPYVQKETGISLSLEESQVKENRDVLAPRDKSGNKNFKVATRALIGKKNLDKAKVPCGDGHRSHGAFAKKNAIEYQKFNATKGQRTVDKIYHVQNVNNLDM